MNVIEKIFHFQNEMRFFYLFLNSYPSVNITKRVEFLIGICVYNPNATMSLIPVRVHKQQCPKGTWR